MLFKPILGGAFGRGRYAMCSMPAVSRGLHSVRFMVLQPESGAVLSVAEDRVEALSQARRVIAAVSDLQEAQRQHELWPALETGAARTHPAISRRRREVHARCGGRCFYCSTEVSIDEGEIEHQLPRALGGENDSLNLVLACAGCNRRKSDRTAIEFLCEHDGSARPTSRGSPV